MPNPTAAMLVIGDEILSGRTRDKNFHHLAQELTLRGIDLREVRFISDESTAIADAVWKLSGRYAHVFTSGGIGPTHDDITAEAVAAALDLPITERADALEILERHYTARGQSLNDARRRMARIPEGATLIDNPISAAPGFSIRNIHVMAGVPSIFEAMLAGLLPGLTGGRPLLSQTLRVDRGEGDIAGVLTDLAAEFSDLSVGSYPFEKDGGHGVNVVVRGPDGARVDEAIVRLSTLLAP
ncbi:competence/damage-inducible protein A [Pseudoroseicyclus aestuarii]|uniref:Molybdenum cofactor synthesis domain-containing protein n=1 Tax=Pseudoroseicyclus aestuarii TaxID=1795041 RepID=A0A318SP96_9RHOB|nr:molybdopterin-binding protein [Pseudoroseicyclus aestuarii]PYE83701.1 molybdenum cofactor synthesis domain-containing protein [Pseudoroseicyclus aestuarii]